MVMSMFTFLGNMDPFDGYGYSAIKIAQAFECIAFAGSVARVVSLAGQDGAATRPNVQGTAVCLAPPVWWPLVKGADKLLGYTMFETTRLPTEYVKAIARSAHGVIVPTAWGKSVFEESGVTAPVEVVPLGIDPADYYPLERERENGRPYTFAWSGTPDMRKGWDVAYRAFRRAFGDRDDVRLRLHFRRLPKDGIAFRDNNVEVLHGSFPLPEMREFYRQADCFVFPSRGEGWGMPPREAAATGLPVIATDWGGLHQDINRWAYPLEVKELAPAEYGHWDAGKVGLWAQPDEDHLIALMRSCVDRREEAAAFGQGASRWLLANNTWERTARGIMTIVALAENQEAVC